MRSSRSGERGPRSRPAGPGSSSRLRCGHSNATSARSSSPRAWEAFADLGASGGRATRGAAAGHPQHRSPRVSGRTSVWLRTAGQTRTSRWRWCFASTPSTSRANIWHSVRLRGGALDRAGARRECQRHRRGAPGARDPTPAPTRPRFPCPRDGWTGRRNGPWHSVRAHGATRPLSVDRPSTAPTSSPSGQRCRDSSVGTPAKTTLDEEHQCRHDALTSAFASVMPSERGLGGRAVAVGLTLITAAARGKTAWPARWGPTEGSPRLGAGSGCEVVCEWVGRGGFEP
jgi:hypothetical protein